MYFYFSESSKYKVDKKSVQGVFYTSQVHPYSIEQAVVLHFCFVT